MNYTFCRCLLLTTLIALAFSCPASDARPDPDTEVEGMLTQLRQLTGVPAFSVAVVRYGRLLLQSVVGEVDVQNHVAATPAHRFRLASVSKAVGATMLALLVQDGSLDPDAPISGYVDGLPESYRNLTTRQLVSHTSGLPHYQARDGLIASTHYANAMESLDSVGERTLVAAPGESYRYSTHGYTFLGALYESITQRPLGETVPEFIDRLSGRESPALENWRQRDSRRSNLFEAGPYGARTLKPRDQSYSPFGTGFTSSAADLAFFGDAVLGSSLITPQTRDLMFQPVALRNGGKTGNYLYEVAFGWRVGKDEHDRAVVHHAGITQGARSVLVLYPGAGLSIALLSNASWTAQIERTAFALANTVLDEQSVMAPVGEYHYSGSFDGEALSGKLACRAGATWCLWSDSRGVFSDWLHRYSTDRFVRPGWPAQLVEGSTGLVLRLLTTVGIVELRCDPAGTFFVAEIGNGRVLKLHFAESAWSDQPDP